MNATQNPYVGMDSAMLKDLTEFFQIKAKEAREAEGRALRCLELLKEAGADTDMPLVRLKDGVSRPAAAEATISTEAPTAIPNAAKKGLIPMPFLSEKGRTVPKRIQNDHFPNLLQHLFDLMARKPQKTWNSRTASDALAKRFKIKEDNQLLRTELRRRISIHLQVHYVGSKKNSHQDYWIAEGPDGNRTYRINPDKLPSPAAPAAQQPAEAGTQS